MINLYFGSPCDDWAKETAELMAINHNLSMEKAVFEMVKELLNAFSDRSDGHSFLDDRFSWTYERLVHAPKIIPKQETKNGIKYSVMSIAEDFVVHKATGDRLPLTDRALTIFGEDFEDSFGIKYLGHQWGGKQMLLNMRQTVLF
jgi:hypothetical protein